MALTEIPIELSSTPSIVDGGNATAITIDSSEKVGIGTASPTAPLNSVSAYSSGAITTSLKLATVGGYNSNSGTSLDFGQDQGTYPTWLTGRIASPRTGNNWGGSLTFSTNDNSAETAVVERMRIDASGNLLVGKTSTAFGTAGAALYASGDNDFVNDGNVMSLNRLNSDGSIINLYKDGTAVGVFGALGGSLMIGGGDVGIGFYQGSDALVPSNGVTATRDNAIDLGMSDSRFKDIFLSGGVNFSANANAGGMTSELLDDYEEGTWTPTVTTSSGSISYAAQQAAFVKVGNVVHYWIRLVATCTATATLYNLSLPFSTSGYNVFYAGPAVANAYNVTLGSGGTVLGGYYINSNNAIRMHSYGNNTGQVSPSVTANTAFELRMEGSYRVAA